jgi:AraC-like DNA-binding protein
LDIFEHLSTATGLGVEIIGVTGEKKFSSALHAKLSSFLQVFLNALESTEADRSALLYGCYQSRRFGGRYIFLTPSGFTYCTSPLTDASGNLTAGVVTGPFLMTDYDEYLEMDVFGQHEIDAPTAERIKKEIHMISFLTPAQVRSVGELLYTCVMSLEDTHQSVQQPALLQTDALSMTYSIQKESELLSAISSGDTSQAKALLNDILGYILFSPGLNMETLRLRVFELTVLLSRAAVKGGANIDAIFGLNYSYLREIDALATPEDAVQWLHSVTRRFAQHVFDFADSKHVDVLYKAISFIKSNYAEKITLQDVADSVYLNMTYFSKVFKDETGQTPGNFITATRIEAGKKLLQDPSISIIDIPGMVGFESQSYFTRVFKKTEGCTPAQYRRMNRSQSNYIIRRTL